MIFLYRDDFRATVKMTLTVRGKNEYIPVFLVPQNNQQFDQMTCCFERGGQRHAAPLFLHAQQSLKVSSSQSPSHC